MRALHLLSMSLLICYILIAVKWSNNEKLSHYFNCNIILKSQTILPTISVEAQSKQFIFQSNISSYNGNWTIKSVANIRGTKRASYKSGFLSIRRLLSLMKTLSRQNLIERNDKNYMYNITQLMLNAENMIWYFYQKLVLITVSWQIPNMTKIEQNGWHFSEDRQSGPWYSMRFPLLKTDKKNPPSQFPLRNRLVT